VDEDHSLLDRVESAQNISVQAGAFYGGRAMTSGDHGYLLIDQEWQQGPGSVTQFRNAGGNGRSHDVAASIH
jgi:hypothetical protein